MQKLGLSNRAALVRYALAHGLLDEEPELSGSRAVRSGVLRKLHDGIGRPDSVAGGREHRLERLIDTGRTLVSSSTWRPSCSGAWRRRASSRTRAMRRSECSTSRAALERFLTVGIDDETHQAIGDLPRGRGVLGVLIREPRPLRLPDVGKHARSYGFPLGHPPMKSFLGVPILVRGKPYGNLYLTEEGGDEFDEQDEESSCSPTGRRSRSRTPAATRSSKNAREELERLVSTFDASTDRRCTRGRHRPRPIWSSSSSAGAR